MIARGDLAVECGYERLAEVQEEILWMCEAAHMPVIWATQVLESVAKQGEPSRAGDHRRRDERAGRVRDAQQGPAHRRARCGTLDDILQRMQDPPGEEASDVRPLRLADDLGQIIR